MTVRRTISVSIVAIGIAVLLSSLLHLTWFVNLAVGLLAGTVNVAGLVWRGRSALHLPAARLPSAMMRSFASRAAVLLLALMYLQHTFSTVDVSAVLIGFFVPQGVLWAVTLSDRGEVKG